MLNVSHVTVRGPTAYVFHLADDSDRVPTEETADPTRNGDETVTKRGEAVPEAERRVGPEPNKFVTVRQTLYYVDFMSVVQTLPYVCHSGQGPYHFTYATATLTFAPSSVTFTTV